MKITKSEFKELIKESIVEASMDSEKALNSLWIQGFDITDDKKLIYKKVLSMYFQKQDFDNIVKYLLNKNIKISNDETSVGYVELEKALKKAIREK